MTVLLFVLVGLAVLGLLVLVHRWLWVRLVRDTGLAGAWRTVGTALTWALPLLSVGALVAGRAGAPFWLQKTLAWPGYMWLAVLLYLSLALLVAEPVRALWLRRTRGAAPDPAPQTPARLDSPSGRTTPPAAEATPAPPAFEARGSGGGA
ncbi:metallophosphoesterase, partial [Streptomyces sp. NPDC089919]